MIENIIKELEDRMTKSIEALRTELSRIRSGRANPSLLDHVTVLYYGNETPLNQVANISTEDPRTLSVSPWEKSMIPAIEKAIMSAGLGLNPSTSGSIIRVPLPSLTEERRKEMVKTAKSEAENTRVAVRNVRRDANNQLKALLKDKKISEDDERKAADRTQKLTDKYIAAVDEILAKKEQELMHV